MPTNIGNSKPKKHFIKRTTHEIFSIWGHFKKLLSGNLAQSDLKKRIKECINAKGGQVLAREMAVELGIAYLQSDSKNRESFLSILAYDFNFNENLLKKKIERYQNSKDKNTSMELARDIRTVLIPPRVKLFKRFNALPNGFKFLIDMRADILNLSKKNSHYKHLGEDLKELLTTWFDVGLLDLKRITWESPASVLEKLIEYEAVHRIKSWHDLKNRLDSDRLCYAFFHNKIPKEPLIFVELALQKHISENIDELLDEEAETIPPDAANTAIFYSISSTQYGLTGISLGNFLIKQVVEELSANYSNIKTFATLSPIPLLRKWLDPKLRAGNESIFTESEIAMLKAEFKCENVAVKLGELLKDSWFEDKKLSKTISPVLRRLTAVYLTSTGKNKKAIDPVANFHLSNGAIIEKINLNADIPNGLKHSYGIMVNYLYKVSIIEKNHENYATYGIIETSKQIKNILK